MSLFHSPSIRSPLPQELPLFFSSQSVFFHSPSPFLPVLGSVLHGRLGGFEVHLEFWAQAPLFLSLFCCNLIGWSHCSARNHISLNEEHHTCLLFPPWLEYAQLNPKRGGVRDHGKGEKGPWRLSALDMSLFPPKSIHHLNRADMFIDTILWKGGMWTVRSPRSWNQGWPLDWVSAHWQAPLWIMLIFVIFFLFLKKQMFPLSSDQSVESLGASLAACFFTSL